jgi:hypothetical protein
MKFFPATFKRYSRTENGTPQTSLAAYDPVSNQAFLNVHPVADRDAGAKAAERADRAFAAGEFTPVGSENWRSCDPGFLGMRA